MILYPPAKINIGLYITSKRTDGYHNIETVFFPIGFSDILEFTVDPRLEDDQLTLSGLDIPGRIRDNILVDVCRQLRKISDFPPVHIHLHKRIPTGAGLGGGSSDAAFLLSALVQECKLPLTSDEVFGLALQLGSDCPFFLLNKPAIGKGRGELLTEINLRLSGYYLLLFHPRVHVSTGEAYSRVGVGTVVPGIESLIDFPVEKWRSHVSNTFEDSVLPAHPEIRETKEGLYRLGAVYASMSGSGSAVYGLFRKRPVLDASLSKWLIWEEYWG